MSCTAEGSGSRAIASSYAAVYSCSPAALRQCPTPGGPAKKFQVATSPTAASSARAAVPARRGRRPDGVEAARRRGGGGPAAEVLSVSLVASSPPCAPRSFRDALMLPLFRELVVL